MSELDKVIEQEIVQAFKLGMLDVRVTNGPDPLPALRERGENIKQAFADEEMKKWGDPISEQELKEIKVINYKEFQTITGQEWYDRFCQLLKDRGGKVMKMGETIYIEEAVVIEAAKRASSIEEIK